MVERKATVVKGGGGVRGERLLPQNFNLAQHQALGCTRYHDVDGNGRSRYEQTDEPYEGGYLQRHGTGNHMQGI